MHNRLRTRPFVEIFSELCKTQNLVASKSAEEWRCAAYFSIFVCRHIDCSLCRISSEGASEPQTYITLINPFLPAASARPSDFEMSNSFDTGSCRLAVRDARKAAFFQCISAIPGDSTVFSR
jgi:hypothetical protein